ncbi:MAG: hypothetical protein AAGA55_06890 [Planctomycetota bacterium]
MDRSSQLAHEWSERLIAIAERSLSDAPALQEAASPQLRIDFVEQFEDERRHRARVATPFLSALLSIAPSDPKPARMDLDDRLWWAVHDPQSRIADVGTGEGPLDPSLGEIAIETRTETELAAMHALFRLGLDRSEPGMIERALDAARWQVAELQPDNGTNHPWGIHVFVVLSARCAAENESAAALMHAQTMLHNCQVALGRPDRLSACVLLDAGRTLARIEGQECINPEAARGCPDTSRRWCRDGPAPPGGLGRAR